MDKSFVQYTQMNEGIMAWLKKAGSLLKGLINKLGFGKSETLDINITLTEESNIKGLNGLMAEYVCAENLCRKLTDAGFEVATSVDTLERDRISKQTEFSEKGLTGVEMNRAINQGAAIADSMFESISADGKDLIFTDYEFKSTEHVFDVMTTGADTSKVTADDMKIVVTKKDAEDVKKEILVSLKAYNSSTTSLGSNSSLTTLSGLFMGKTKFTPQVKADFLKEFGKEGADFVASLAEYKEIAGEFLKKPDSKELRDYYANKGKKANPSGNVLRRAQVGAYYEKKKGVKHEHQLSDLFVKCFDKGINTLKKSGDQKKFRDGMMRILGVDDSVVTYNAIADKKGIVSEVVNSNVSDAYRKLYHAIADGATINLDLKQSAKGVGIIVNCDYNGQKINGLTLAMWKDGTIQFKFDSHK